MRLATCCQIHRSSAFVATRYTDRSKSVTDLETTKEYITFDLMGTLSGFYSCFEHPAPQEEKSLASNLCPICQRAYDFQLKNPPATIADCEVQRSIGRGFYGATFVVSTKPFGNLAVMKVVPVRTYEFLKYIILIFKLLIESIQGKTSHTRRDLRATQM